MTDQDYSKVECFIECGAAWFGPCVLLNQLASRYHPYLNDKKDFIIWAEEAITKFRENLEGSPRVEFDADFPHLVRLDWAGKKMVAVVDARDFKPELYATIIDESENGEFGL